MKVEFAVALVSLILVVSCAADQYVLKCSPNELGVLWPNYDDASKYYQCLNVGKPYPMECSAGTMFTFVYQSCTLPEEYIPPPPLSSLPTDPPTSGDTTTPGTNTPGDGDITTPSVATPTPTPVFTFPTPKTGSTPTSTSTSKSSSSSSKTTKSTSTTTTTPSSGNPTPPSGSTGIEVPGPPSPVNTDIPMPDTPAPTPPVAETAPPEVDPTVGTGRK